jgi:hypothetical protein
MKTKKICTSLAFFALLACTDRNEPRGPSNEEIDMAVQLYCEQNAVPCIIEESCEDWDEPCYTMPECMDGGRAWFDRQHSVQCESLLVEWMACTSELTCEEAEEARQGGPQCRDERFAMYDAVCQ